jgi:outer membrane protein assembly factor BamB
MKRALLAVAVLLVLGVAAGAAYVLYIRSEGANIHGSSSLEFTPTTQRAPTSRDLLTIPWPMFGRDPARLGVAAGVKLRPPFRRLWLVGGAALFEFPPAIGYGRLYLSNAGGTLAAYSAHTGGTAWLYHAHRCTASTPAVAHHIVYETFLNRPPCNAPNVTNGEVVALRTGNGKLVWRRRIGPSESSPLVAGRTVYVGDWRGKVYALDALTGRRRWTFSAGGRVKGGVALAGNHVFFGSYDHHMYALDARTGRLQWRASPQARLGGAATFYATPAVAYGRVYIGGTDGKVYSFGAATGKIRWSHGTGGYVYGTAAVWNKHVFVGSYDHTFYSFDAATGNVQWRFHANGPISGSATVVDGIVYFATLNRRTYGLDANTGHKVVTFSVGKYTPVVADTKHLYLMGYSSLRAFLPRR